MKTCENSSLQTWDMHIHPYYQLKCHIFLQQSKMVVSRSRLQSACVGHEGDGFDVHINLPPQHISQLCVIQMCVITIGREISKPQFYVKRMVLYFCLLLQLIFSQRAPKSRYNQINLSKPNQYQTCQVPSYSRFFSPINILIRHP